jgi:hypothetical protein
MVVQALRSAVEGAIHGSLLCLGQLLLNSNEFMSSRAGEVCGILLRYKDNQNKLIKNAVISLLPRTAASNREEFTKVRPNQTYSMLYQLFTLLCAIGLFEDGDGLPFGVACQRNRC